MNSAARKEEYQNSGKTEEQLYQHSKQDILDMYMDNKIGDQQDLEGSAVYIFGGEQDQAVPPVGPIEQRKYYTDLGALVSYHMEPEYGHWYPEDTIAGDVSNWCYRKRGGAAKLNDYKYEKGDADHIPEYYN